jgi:hypothetical protein
LGWGQRWPHPILLGGLNMAYRNNLRQNKLILYRLKHSFGMSTVFKFPTTNTYDITTGATTRAYTEFTVRKTIILPARLSREFSYDLAFIASNKNFTYGGLYDKTARNLIIQKSDLKGYTPTLEWRCVFENRDYSVKEINETEDSEGYVLICNHLDETAS